MKICLVTTFPPSQGGLSEYGLHIAEELRRNPFVSLTILADQIASPEPELDGFSVQRCWSFDDPTSSTRILKALHRLKPDVVWFNLLFSTFGRNPLNAFLGLLTPLMARLSGRYTHVTLHHLMDTVDLKDAGVRHARLYRLAGSAATRMLLLSHSVSVLMPGYRKILHDKYGRDNVHLRSHGVLTRRPEYPDFSRRGNPEHRILAFGKWGTYKRLELMIEAFRIIEAELPNAKLVIAGGDHPQAHGYVESMREKHASSTIEFTGYVHEDQLPDLFQASSVAVMPYSSSTGCSGVAHLACAYGVPIVSADIPDFRQMATGEEIALDFYRPGDAQDLARCLIQLLGNSGRQREMAVQNFATALRMTMPTIVQKYLRHFELEKRTEALRQITRFRRMPGWVPSQSLMLRLMTRNSLGWVQRSAIQPALRDSRRASLLNDDIDGGGQRTRPGVSDNSHGVSARGGRTGRNDWGILGSRLVPPTSARTGDHSDAHESTDDEQLQPTPAWQVLAKSKAYESERQKPREINWKPFPLRGTSGHSGSGGDGKRGTGGVGAGSDGGGRERTTEPARESAAGKRDRVIERPGLRLSDDREVS
jgi:glycosyltransferase involved in cell wall biosynthesis